MRIFLWMVDGSLDGYLSLFTDLWNTLLCSSRERNLCHSSEKDTESIQCYYGQRESFGLLLWLLVLFTLVHIP